MEKYVPDMYQKSIYTIDYSKLLSKGIKCLLFDLDNTIVSSKSHEQSKKAKDLFISLKQKGFKVIIFSNSPKSRVNTYKEFFNVEGVHFALKPLTFKLKKIMKKENLTPDMMAIIGDQIMTDVIMGNKVGITTILINPLGEDHVFSIFNRIRENRVIKKLSKNNLFFRGRYYE